MTKLENGCMTMTSDIVIKLKLSQQRKSKVFPIL